MNQHVSMQKSKRQDQQHGRCFDVAILLTERFSLLSLASLTDVFESVQTASPSDYVNVSLLTASGKIIGSHSNVKIVPDGRLSDYYANEKSLSKPDLFIVCSGKQLSEPDEGNLLALTRWCRVTATPLCVIGAAIRTIAQSGHITRGTDHWSRIPVNRETCPEVEFEECIFVCDRKLVSCSGELGAMDFALNWVEANVNAKVADWTRNNLLLQSVRNPERKQTCTIADRYRGIPRVLEAAIQMMVDNLEEPLPIREIADVLGTSTRQLERLFKRDLDTSPLKFYRAQQLELGRCLIEDSNMPVSEISIVCGFQSCASFAKLFKNRFGKTPSEYRRSRTCTELCIPKSDIGRPTL
ncbi:GlxA family transcriptional regulator [Phaeobacter sp. C3_T13_0]|uniref:GlxA family transcriptional regulator n=1 Tax=Phaeobacter cretensis TaxID=3342641 RepID=UPI0039BC24D3